MNRDLRKKLSPSPARESEVSSKKMDLRKRKGQKTPKDETRDIEGRFIS